MNSKRTFLWSRRQSSSEPYYRTGGLLPIDAQCPKAFAEDVVQRPSSLQIALLYDTQFALSPTFLRYDAAWNRTGSNLQAAFNDILRSPMLGASSCVGSASIQKPLPSRPRSVSIPTTPELPAELPGSILLENQGYPSDHTFLDSRAVTQASQTTSRATQSANRHTDQKSQLDRLSLVPEPLTHAKSVPNLSMQQIEMHDNQILTALNSATAVTTESSRANLQHKRFRSETNRYRRSRSNFETAPSSAEKKPRQNVQRTAIDVVDVAEVVQPSSRNVIGDVWDTSNQGYRNRRQEDVCASASITPTPTRNRQIEAPETTSANREDTISTSQAKSRSLGPLKKFPPTSPFDAPVAAGTTLSTKASVLEERPKSTLQHTYSYNPLVLVEATGSPQTPTCESTHDTRGTSTPSSQSAQEKQQRSPQRLYNSPEMENLKRKLSSTRRPETTNRNLLPELNQYKQNNFALQKQIESLMAKLNDSKKKERETRAACEKAEQECVKWEAKAQEATGVVKDTKALQNTIDHLESRLEIANTKRLDAEEQLCNIQANRSPFDTALTQLCGPSTTDTTVATQDPHISLSTVFSDASPRSPDRGRGELPTFSAPCLHFDRLQDQIKQKDAHIAELCREVDELKSKHDHLQAQHDEVTLRSDIQADLLQKSRETDMYLEQLRTAVFDREAIIIDKEKSIRAIERQLDLHKLLLQAEIRRHATMKLNRGADDEALPALTTLAKQEDLDRWISNLHRRLQKENPAEEFNDPSSRHEAELKNLRNEVDFYVREIIYYKLDIRGYKSDIRKLKRVNTQLSGSGCRASDLDSESSSLRPAPTPSRSRFASATPEIGPPNATSPTGTGPISMSPLTCRTITPTPAKSKLQVGSTPPKSTGGIAAQRQLQPDLDTHTTPQTLKSSVNLGGMKKASNGDAAVVPTGPKGSVSQSRKAASLSHHHETFGELLVTMPLMSPDRPQQLDVPRGMSESTSELRTMSGTPKRSNSVQHVHSSISMMSETHRDRSASLSDTTDIRTSPSRPSRPRLGLFRFPSTSSKPKDVVPRTPQIDVEDTQLQHSTKADDLIVHGSLQDNTSSSPNELTSSITSGRIALTEQNSGPAILEPASTIKSQEVTTMLSMDDPGLDTLPSPERKLSAVSNSSMPFFIDMGSPHNPALIAPTTDYRPTSCSITRNASLKINASVARTGVGDTVTSTTPLISPISPTAVQSVRSKFAVTALESPTGATEQDTGNKQRGPSTPSHSRTLSGSGIRTAIRMPKLGDKQNTGIVRKDSMSYPIPLKGSFGLEPSPSIGSDSRGHNSTSNSGADVVYGIGEAI
ncbi:hypothetical protein J1614_001822 [Plenodomus biglobosus]|nr:hypothetical protein J1614_001822 [Plenodomus biglobosus]